MAVYEQSYLKGVQGSETATVIGTLEVQLSGNATCTGTPRATHNASFNFTIDGTLPVNGKTADKVTVNVAAINGGVSSGGRIVLNGISYPGDYFTRTSTDKDLSLVEGTNWFVGTEITAASPYPTTLEATAALVKR